MAKGSNESYVELVDKVCKLYRTLLRYRHKY